MENPTFDFAYLWNMARYELFLQVFVVVLILVSGIPDDAGSGTCSAGDIHCDGGNDSSHQYQDVQRLVSNTTAHKLIRAQTEVARYFEIGYLAVADFPDLSGKVRLKAHESKTLHMMTVDLMRNYMTTAKHILDHVLPMVITSVETQDKDLFFRLLNRIVDIVDEMRKDAADANKDYRKVHNDIQTLVNHINDRKRGAEKEREEIRMDKMKKMNNKEENEKDESQIEDDIEEVESKIQGLESEAKEMKDSIGKIRLFFPKRKQVDCSNLYDATDDKADVDGDMMCANNSTENIETK